MCYAARRGGNVPIEPHPRYVWRYQYPIGRSTNGTFVRLLEDRIVSSAFGHGLHALSCDGELAWELRTEADTHFFAWQDRVLIGGESAQSLAWISTARY